MIQNIQVEGVERAIAQIKNFGIQLIQKVGNMIRIFGDQIVQELQIDYPDLAITGQFFLDNMEYWITIQQLGAEKVKIKCPVSGLFLNSKVEAQSGEKSGAWDQKFTSVNPELDIDALRERIVSELSLEINQIIKV